MKSLDQVEPRRPISSLPFTISEPGAYYLTGNLQSEGSGITVAADSVVLDLMGFELVGPGSGTGDGLWVSGTRANLTVRNGSFRSWRIAINASNARNSLFEQLRVSGNTNAGLWVTGTATTVRACGAFNNGGVGILAGEGSMIFQCTAADNGGDGLRVLRHGSIASSVATNNGGHGISGGRVVQVRDCTSSLNSGSGIFVEESSLVEGCLVNANGGHGIRVFSQSVVRNNTADFHRDESAGIFSEGFGSRIEGNNCTRNAYGIRVINGANVITRNTAWASTELNYAIAPGNQLGLVGNLATVGDEPWANLSY